MQIQTIKRSLAAALCAVMMVSSPLASFGVLAAEDVSEEGSEQVLENESGNASEASSSHVVYGWNEESLTLHYETGYAPAWEALSSVLPTSVSANTDEGTVDVAIKGWTYNESYDVNKTGTYLIESVIDEKYALGEGVSNYAAFVVIEDVNHAVHFTGLDDIIAAPGSNVNVLDGVLASDGSVEYTVGISSITAIDGSGQAVSEEEIELGEEEPVLFSVVDGYTYTVHLVALDEAGEITDAEPAIRMVYVRDIVQPRAPSLKAVKLPANPASGTTSIDDFSVEFISGGAPQSGAYIWTATRSTSGHQFVYMVSYSTSGVGTSEPGALEIRIPLHMMKDRFGNYTDTIEMSVPHEDEITDLDLMLGLTEYAYKIEGDEVVFFNVTEISAAVNGYFEVAYSLNDPTFNYVDMGRSDEMRASMAINSLTAEDTDWPFGINTTAKINSTDKRFPTLYEEWNTAWGTAPVDAGDYYYLVWEIRSVVDDYITQPYSLEFTDIPASDNGTVELVGYKLSGQGSYSMNNIVTESRSAGYRYDYILTRHLKSEFEPLDAYQIKNNISITLTPIDGLDAPSTVRSNRNFPWERPEFKYPTGHFMSYKRGDGAYRRNKQSPGSVYAYSYLTDLGFRNGMYTRYDLQSFNGKDDEPITMTDYDGFDYAVWTVGYPYPWTIEDGADWHDPDNFGVVPVRYEQIDEGVYLYADGGAVSTRELTSADFEIDTLDYQVAIRDEDYNEKTCAFESKTGTFLDTDILNIYTKATDNSNEWLLSATVNLLTGETNILREAAISEAPAATLLSGKTRGTITFGDNIVAYKLETSNAHYFSEIDSVPNMHLKNSAYVMETVNDLDSIALRNTVKGTIYKTTDGSVIQTHTEQDTDFACVTQRDSYIRKTVVSTENNKKYKYFGITWKIAMEETVTFDQGDRDYVTQSSGTFYDLLPEGMHIEPASVAVQTQEGYLAENAYSVQTIANYKNSGRDLLIVFINEEAQYYNLFFTTKIDWNGITDFGTEIYNPAAYETGNNDIKYGTCDDGGTIAESDKALMTGLDAECTTNRFIYAGQRYDIAALTAATAGLTKHIREEKDPLFISRTETTPDGTYYYRLRYANTIRTKAKDLILYDSLENYRINGELVGGGALGEEFDSDWHGSLQAIDLSQIIAMGAAPVVYLSRTANLVFLNNDVGNLPDLTNTSVWKRIDQFGDISEATAIAIDIRKASDGSDFILDQGQSVSAILQMKAPEGASSAQVRIPVSYNNVYISDTVIDLFDNEIPKYIHHDYTQIQFIVKGNIKLHKTSSLDGSDIKGIRFRLKGTSDYGDEVDEFAKTNRKGEISFTDIPKGTYLLSEYEGIPDYLEDHTELTVQIADDGKVWFTNKNGVRSEITNGQAEITNDPRVHADIPIGKRDNTSTDLPVQDTTFKLSGTSDYGNEIVMVETTDSITGNLTFRDVEKGTYTLEEIQSNPNYINSGRKYTVIVDGDGNVSIGGTTVEAITEEEPFTMRAKYAVSVYDIEADVDENGETMGLTFGPALGADYITSFKSHTPEGNTLSGNPHRCIHNDDWDTIIEWNQKDPGVYEDCISEGCTHSVELDLTKSGNFNPDFVFSKSGDGVSVLRYELTNPLSGTSTDHNRLWNGQNTNAGGWGASRIRAMLNGWDDNSEDDGVVTNATNAKYSSDIYDELDEAYQYENSLIYCFPDKLQAAIGKRATKYDSVYDNKTEGNLKTTCDKLWLLSSNEIWTHEYNTDANYQHPLEGSQFEYFTQRANLSASSTNSNLRGYYMNNSYGTAYSWWLRSSYGLRANGVFYVSNRGSWGNINACLDSGVAPCFSLSRSEIISDEELSGPSNDGTRYLLFNERYHRVSFSKRSSLDNTGLAGATFRLHGMSNYGRPFDETVTSGANGTVSFEKVESGVYTLQEIEAPEGYALDSKEYPVIVYRNGEVEIKGFQYDAENHIYYTNNIKKRDKEIVITKKWVDEKSNDEREMPSITLTTVVPRGRVRYYTVRYHADNATQNGTFAGDETVNEVRYEAVTTAETKTVDGPLVAYSYTQNLDETGAQNGNYGNSWTNNHIRGTGRDSAVNQAHVISLPGALKLKVTITYGGESARYDWVCMWVGSYPTYTAASNSGTSLTGKLGGDSHAYASNTKEYIVDGDTVTFAFRSDSGGYGDGYGYYAVVQRADSSGKVTTAREYQVYTTTYTEVGSGTYERPTITEAGYGFGGWYADDTNQTEKFEMTGEASMAAGRLPVSSIFDLDTDNDKAVDVYAKYTQVMLIKGDALNTKLKTLAKGIAVTSFLTTDKLIKAIHWSNEEPSTENRTDANIISTDDSPYPIYAWFDNTDGQGIIYMWSSADTVFAHTKSSDIFYRMNNLVDISALTYWHTENVTNMNAMFYDCYSLTNVDSVANWATGQVADMKYMFYECRELANVDGLANWNTEKVTNMSDMFFDCPKLTNVDGLANWQTGNVTDMQYMFYECSGLTNLGGIANWDTGNVTSMLRMFYNCRNLANVASLANWNTGNVANMSYMFYYSLGLTNLNGLTKWNTEKVKDMSYMFYGCKKLANVDALAEWNTGNVNTMSSMFRECSLLTDISGLADWNTEKVTVMSYMFNKSGIADLNPLAGWNTGSLTTMESMFESCSWLTQLDGLNDWNTGKITNMKNVFTNCNRLADLSALSEWNTGKVIDMTSMFSACTSIVDLAGLEKWNVENVQNMTSMFFGCAFSDINALENWNTKNVKTMESMFHGCLNLINVDSLEKWDTGNVTTMRQMFRDCSGLTNVDGLANWNMGKVTTIEEMFRGCSSLANVNGLINWNTINIGNMKNLFNTCTNLTDLSGVAGWNTEKVTNMSAMFCHCTSLTDLNKLTAWNTGNVTDISQMFFNCSGLTNASGINSWADKIAKCTNFTNMFNNANSQHPDWASVYPNGTWDSYGTFSKNQ